MLGRAASATFRSNWLAMHGDINKLVLMSGHTSVDTMWKHYHRGTKKSRSREVLVRCAEEGGRQDYRVR